jgi:hypothetical protein
MLALMGSPPPVFTKAQVAFAELARASGLAPTRTELADAPFGSSCIEFQGGARGVRLIWDGRDEMLFAETLVAGDWIDVETLLAGRAPPVDLDRGDRRIATVLEAATVALSRQ